MTPGTTPTTTSDVTPDDPPERPPGACPADLARRRAPGKIRRTGPGPLGPSRTTVAAFALVCLTAAASPSGADPFSSYPAEATLRVEEAVAPGVAYRAFTVPTSHGSARLHVLTVDLGHPGVRADLLYPGAVAARAPVSRMAEAQGAVAAVNGDFFDINEVQHPGVQATGAASGPVIRDGQPLKAAVPQGQRFGWTPPPGDTSEDVIGVGTDGRARTARLTLRGLVRTPWGVLPLGGLNQYALPEGSIGAFTAQWGTPSRERAVCGTDDDRAAPCAGEAFEVTVRQGRVESAAATAGSGQIRPDTTVLLGREAGAHALRTLSPGTPVDVDYRLASSPPVPFTFALGGYPLLDHGRPRPGLDTTVADPRSAVGVASGGRLLWLLSTDGREGTSSGLTIAELADVLNALGCADAVYLDGGASATLVTRSPTTHRITVRNNLDREEERPVPNGIAVFSG
ncbi:phosphodiester glycosidase family protein [Kitasatospora sp. NPDC052896]|uniref:phosphodiester glycosidase family protein n=1 Tax=Kitasatospora sp. NPDC052896 TaxID=3364061 RepID=UPI0037C7AF0C